jgi:deoxyxylulose-5-phosphate synthase
MNESITTSRSAWKVKWLPNRTEADQGSQREKAELVPTKLKKKARKCTVMEPEAVSKTNNALLKAVLKTHLWKCQLEEGKLGSVRELSTIVNISMRCIEQILRLNYLSH